MSLTQVSTITGIPLDELTRKCVMYKINMGYISDSDFQMLSYYTKIEGKDKFMIVASKMNF